MTNIPNEFICPITLEKMEDPVICEDGYTYERLAILSTRGSLSPMTRQPIDKTKLIPNRALKNSILRYDEEILAKSSDLHTHIENTAEATVDILQNEIQALGETIKQKLTTPTTSRSISIDIDVTALVKTMETLQKTCVQLNENLRFTELSHSKSNGGDRIKIEFI